MFPVSNTPARSALKAAVQRILRPLVRILLRNGIACAECIDWLKQAYVSVAMQEFRAPGRKPTISHAAVVTGLTRKDVQRMVQQQQGDDDDGPVNRAARVVAGWVRDQAFHGPDGSPRPLSFDGEQGFAELVRRYSGDMPPRAVLDELLRVGAVGEDDQGRAVLKARSYIPAQDELAKLHILGTDVSALLETIDHNISRKSDNPRYQRKVRYDNIPLSQITALRPQIAERCQALLEELDKLLAEYDRDTNTSITGDGRGVAGVGIYYFEHVLREDGDLPE